MSRSTPLGIRRTPSMSRCLCDASETYKPKEKKLPEDHDSNPKACCPGNLLSPQTQMNLSFLRFPLSPHNASLGPSRAIGGIAFGVV